MALFCSFLQHCVVFHCIYVPHLLYPFICWWTFRLFPCLGYCEQCCYEHRSAYFFNKFIYFIYFHFWLCWVSVAVRGLSLVVASGGYSSLRCAGFSLRWLLLLPSTGSRGTGFSSCGTPAQQLWLAGSRAQAQQLWRTGLVALLHVGSSQTRALTRVPCIGRQILNHCTTREARIYLFELRFCLDICPGVGLLGHMVVLFLVLRGTSILFSTVAASASISTNSVRGFHFLHTLSSICYLQTL